jgi:hypothetical protein
MADALIDFFNIILRFFSDIAGFINDLWLFLQNGLYQFFTEWFAAFVIWSTVAMLKAKLQLISFSWDVAQSVLVQLDISSFLSSAWSQMDSDVLNAITFFNIPDAINIILSASMTRYVMRFIGL